MNGEARGRRRSDGTRHRRLHRTRAIYPPGPLRFLSLLMVNISNMMALPSWVGRTSTDEAVVAAWPLKGPGRRRWRMAATVAVLVGVLDIGILATAVVVWVFVNGWVALGVVIAIEIVVFWPIVMTAREARSMAPLRTTQKNIADEVERKGGRLYFASDLVSGGHGGGADLVHLLVDQADAQEVTLIGRTEAGVLARLYADAGFEVAAEAPTWWGTAVLVVRKPREVRGGAAGAPVSAGPFAPGSPGRRFGRRPVVSRPSWAAP